MAYLFNIKHHFEIRSATPFLKRDKPLKPTPRQARSLSRPQRLSRIFRRATAATLVVAAAGLWLGYEKAAEEGRTVACASASITAADHAGTAMPALPVTGAYSHNDYEHAAPLEDALNNGFSGVEADIWLKGGKLLVGHTEESLSPSRTLQSLYLDPLAALARKNGGSIYKDGKTPLLLMIDLKTQGNDTYDALAPVLAEYGDVLSAYTPHGLMAGAVTVAMSGNMPDGNRLAQQPQRYAANAASVASLSNDTGVGASYTPLLSDKWTDYFTWIGSGPMPELERNRLAAIVSAAHQRGEKLRFWCTPDNNSAARANMWNTLARAGVDYISTDHLADLSRWLTSRPGLAAVTAGRQNGGFRPLS